jgi:hypothetical protein
MLLLVGAVGALMAGALLGVTFSTPTWVEDFAAEFLAREVAHKIDAGIDAVQAPNGQSRVARATAALYRRNEAEIARTKESLRAFAHAQAPDLVARLRDPGCACRAQWEQWLHEDEIARLAWLGQAKAGLVDFIQGSYARSVAGLKRDLRVFAGANLAAFLLLLALASSKPRAIAQLFVPAMLLATSAAICSYFYLFRQDWLLTLVFRDYLGVYYLAYLGVAFALLCDIALNRARVTTQPSERLPQRHRQHRQRGSLLNEGVPSAPPGNCYARFFISR